MIRKVLATQIEIEKGADGAPGPVICTISTEDVDRDGDVARVSGWQLDNYRKNPVVLFGHDASELPVGRAKRTWISNDNKLKAEVEFASHQRAKDVETLVRQGFLNTTSVGFMPLEAGPRKDVDHPWALEFTKQELLEFSFVPIPANPQAQVESRAARDALIKSLNPGTGVRPTTPAPPVSKEKSMNLKALLAAALAASLLTKEQADEIEKSVEKKEPESKPDPRIEALEKSLADMKKQLMTTTTDPAAQMAKDAAEKGKSAAVLPKWGHGKRLAEMRKRFAERDPLKGKGLGIAQVALAIPYARSVRGMSYSEGADEMGYRETAEKMEQQNVVMKDAAESTVSAGGGWVPETYLDDFIDILTAQAVVRSLLPAGSIVQMKTDTVSIPRVTNDPTSYFLGEAQPATKSDLTPQMVTLNAHKMATEVVISRDLIRDAVVNADEIVRRAMLRSAALREDLAFLMGLGVGGEPKGINALVPSANKRAANATCNLANCKADFNGLIGLLETQNAQFDAAGWVMHPKTKAALFAQMSVNGVFVFENEMRQGNYNLAQGSFRDPTMSGTLQGFQWRKSTQLPAPGDSCPIIFGNWAEFIIGERMAAEIEEDTTYVYGGTTQSASARDQIVLRLWRRLDCCVRHPESFALLTATGWTP